METLRLATEAADIGIWDLNVETGELHWSSRARAIYGVPDTSSLTFSDFTDRLGASDHDRVLAAINAAMNPSGSGEYDIEFCIRRPSGEERHVHARGKAFFDVDGNDRKPTRFVGTLLDRTDGKLAEAALAQAEQLAATGRLAAAIAHEINNPLESVTNLLYLLRDEPDEELRRSYITSAESELARASDIAANTLRFYRDPKGVTEVSLPQLTESVLGLFQGHLALHRVSVDLHCVPEAQVHAAQGELRQVLVNLLNNAIDAMPEGGRIRLRCRTFDHQIGNLSPGVGLCIADTGSGMTPDVLRKACDAFYTTKGSTGTGIGLWLSREILKKHGFKLWVKSKPDRGTVFSIFMPASASAANAARQAAMPA